MRHPIGAGLIEAMTRFRVKRYRISPPHWAGRPPLRIGVLSDLHWGFAPMNRARMDCIKRRLAATTPDLVVFLGDLSAGFRNRTATANVPLGAEMLAGIGAPLGTYAVLGNHDWHDDPEAQRRRGGPVLAAGALDNAGFTVLQNKALRPVRDDIWIAGIDSQGAIKAPRFSGRPRREGRDDLPATLAQAKGDDPVILLAHEPDIFPQIKSERIVLTLSGHMHAGQVRLPGGRLIYAPSRYGSRYAYGHFEENERHLVVSCGLGCSTLPIRMGAVPEITIVEIA